MIRRNSNLMAQAIEDSLDDKIDCLKRAAAAGTIDKDDAKELAVLTRLRDKINRMREAKGVGVTRH